MDFYFEVTIDLYERFLSITNDTNILHTDQNYAKKDLDDAVKLSNESSVYISERGNYYSQIGEFEKAKKEFEELSIREFEAIQLILSVKNGG